MRQQSYRASSAGLTGLRAARYDLCPSPWRSLMPAAETAAKVTYRLKADSIEACNCHHGCNCQFSGFPNEGKCEFIVGYQVKDGNVGQVFLNGVRAVVAAKYPKAIHEGNGHVVLRSEERRVGKAGRS